MTRKIDRLLEYLNYKGISENKATVDCQLSQGLLYRAKTGKADIGGKSIEKVSAQYPDLNILWLLTGEGSMLKGDQPEIPAEEKPTSKSLLIEYLERRVAELEGKVERLTEEKTDLLQQNAVLKYENMMLAPRKGDAEDAASSLSAGAI